jgi:shikimate kinase
MTDASSSAQNVILIGFMGTGKSSIGRMVAHSLGFEFVDTDDRIIESEGKSIAEIFADEGEDYFRDLETKTLLACGSESKQVLATGGGVILREENRRILAKSGYVIWLKASPEAILDRVSRNRDRPLLQTSDPLQTIQKLLKEREELYVAASDFVIDTNELTLDETAFGICESARVIFGS